MHEIGTVSAYGVMNVLNAAKISGRLALAECFTNMKRAERRGCLVTVQPRRILKTVCRTVRPRKLMNLQGVRNFWDIHGECIHGSRPRS